MSDLRGSIEPLPIGRRTPWGRVRAVGLTGGERYYWMVDERGVVAMMPASVVERDSRASDGQGERVSGVGVR